MVLWEHNRRAEDHYRFMKHGAPPLLPKSGGIFAAWPTSPDLHPNVYVFVA